MNGKVTAKWLRREYRRAVWHKCSNCYVTALKDDNCNDILTDECLFCGAEMTNGNVDLSDITKQEKEYD